MVSSDALQVGFLSFLTIVNEGTLLTIVKRSFKKRPFLKNKLFEKTIDFKNDRFWKRLKNETNNDRLTTHFVSSIKIIVRFQSISFIFSVNDVSVKSFVQLYRSFSKKTIIFQKSVPKNRSFSKKPNFLIFWKTSSFIKKW